MDDKFLKPYSPVDTEERIYSLWEKNELFNPDVLTEKGFIDKNAEVFSIVLPPPNVTGTLHMGSAIMLVIEDIFVRFARMRGKKTLWIPGTDSAAIATQAKVEKEIQKSEGKSRHDLGREELLKRIETFVEENKSTILSQIKGIGGSVDWSRYAYTMDASRTHAVSTAFVEMYEAGLIYRGNRIVNWDPKGQTTISDDEIVYEERQSKLYTLKYSKDFPIAISTTRPETKVGDTAVAVHPDDTRYAKYVGKEYDAVFCDVPIHIKIVADKEVDPDFGTGALGVTPAHSIADWDIADRHDLPRPQVINEYARMTVPGRLADKKVLEAREMVVDYLRAEGLLEKEEALTQNVSTSERTGAVVEPLPKLQWWINVNKPIASRGNKTLQEIMKKTVESGATKIIPEYFEKTYFHWIDNLRDWCISRQIWFGHRIPVWYKGDEVYCGLTAPEGDGWTQDPDVLDTWFSSALWPFSTLGWPEKTDDLKTYYPTTLLETGYDILPIWVAKMILMAGFFMDAAPFKTVYLHGLVRDKEGRKISKSLGNNIDPVDMGKKYGTDAVRFSLVSGMAAGTDSKISEEKIRGYKNFANKLWNITRFILENSENVPLTLEGENAFTTADIPELDTWGFWSLAKEVTADLENYQLHLASEKIYHYIWHNFADKVLEDSKIILKGDDTEAKKRVQFALYANLHNCLKLLHPFMPFVTEEIWQSLPYKDSSILMVATWPM